MSILAVDPGSVKAAWGLIPWDLDGGLAAAIAEDMPVANKMVDGRAFSRVLDEHKPVTAVVERVSAMPKQGVSSSFRFGQGYGIILGVLASKDVGIIDVAPGLWKRHFRLDADKEKARALAIKLFPAVNLGRVKDANRAESLLMALWFKETRP